MRHDLGRMVWWRGACLQVVLERRTVWENLLAEEAREWSLLSNPTVAGLVKVSRQILLARCMQKPGFQQFFFDAPQYACAATTISKKFSTAGMGGFARVRCETHRTARCKPCMKESSVPSPGFGWPWGNLLPRLLAWCCAEQHLCHPASCCGAHWCSNAPAIAPCQGVCKGGCVRGADFEMRL